jgi:hypothetical protein
MPHLLANHHSILLPRTPTTTLREGCRRSMLVDCGGSWRNAGQMRGLVVHCSSTTSSSSADQKVGSVGHDHFVNDFGWKVRRLVEKADEMRMVARVQAEAFHVPVALFNDFFFDFFQVSHPYLFSSPLFTFNFIFTELPFLSFPFLSFPFPWFDPVSTYYSWLGVAR